VVVASPAGFSGGQFNADTLRRSLALGLVASAGLGVAAGVRATGRCCCRPGPADLPDGERQRHNAIYRRTGAPAHYKNTGADPCQCRPVQYVRWRQEGDMANYDTINKLAAQARQTQTAARRREADLAARLRRSRRVVVLSGAGISVASGIV